MVGYGSLARGEDPRALRWQLSALSYLTIDGRERQNIALCLGKWEMVQECLWAWWDLTLGPANLACMRLSKSGCWIGKELLTVEARFVAELGLISWW